MFQINRLNFRHIIGNVKLFNVPTQCALSKRLFFSEKELGVDDFRQNRLKVRVRIEKENVDIDLHKTNLIESLPSLPIKEKPKRLYEYLLLTESSQNDLNLLKPILVQYHNETIGGSAATNNDDDVENWTDFHIGTSMMRMFYFLNFPDAAIEFYKDERMKNLFDDMNAYKVMLTLLHNNKRYEEIFTIYNEIRKHVECRKQLPHASINVLAFSACYHLNTQEHYKYARDLYPHVRHIKAFKRRTKYLLAGLALKQNDPMYALQLLDAKEFQIGARFIRLIAFTQCHSFDSAFAVLKQTINVFKQGRMANVPYYGTQVLADLREAIAKAGTNEQLIEFDRIVEDLKSLNLLNEKTLDQLLSAKFPTKYTKTKAEMNFSESKNDENSENNLQM